MSWKKIVKATFVPMGKSINEKLENLVYFVRQNFENNAMDEFEQKVQEIGQKRMKGEYNVDEARQQLLGLQNYFTRQNGVREAYVKIISERVDSRRK